MTFFNSIKMCYMKSFDFKGRASKSEYWWFWLVQVPITFIALGTWNSEKFDVLSGVFLGITIASIPANLSSMVRRFHDAGLSTKQCLKKLSYAVAPFLFASCNHGSFISEISANVIITGIIPLGWQ